jgi:hypothetical protein
MSRRRLTAALVVPALVALSAAVALAPASAAPARSHRCQAVTLHLDQTHLGPLATVLRVNDMTCRRARRVVRLRHPRPDGNVPFTQGGRFKLGVFHCRVYRAVEEDHRARCHTGEKAFRVDYGS